MKTFKMWLFLWLFIIYALVLVNFKKNLKDYCEHYDEIKWNLSMSTIFIGLTQFIPIILLHHCFLIQLNMRFLYWTTNRFSGNCDCIIYLHAYTRMLYTVRKYHINLIHTHTHKAHAETAATQRGYIAKMYFSRIYSIAINILNLIVIPLYGAKPQRIKFQYKLSHRFNYAGWLAAGAS